MKKITKLVKRIGVWKILFAMATAIVSFSMFGYMVYHICFRQSVVGSDIEFFRAVWDAKKEYAYGTGLSDIVTMENGSVWAVLMAVLSSRLGIHPLILCHMIIPLIFMTAFAVIYLYLGIRFFSLQGRGRYYTVVASLIFMAVFIYLTYLGNYSNFAPEAGVYMNPWRGYVVASILVVPLILSTVLRVVKNIKNRKDKKIKWYHVVREGIILAVEVVLLVGTYSMQALYRLSHGTSIKDIITEYYNLNWYIIGAAILLVVALFLRLKGIIPVTITILVTAILGVPAPFAIITALGITGLIFYAEKYSVWHFAAYYIVMLLYLVAWLEGTSVNYQLGFGKVENDYRINQSIVGICDYIDFSKPGASIASSSDLSGWMESYYGDHSVTDLGEVREDNLYDVFRNGLKNAEYIVLRSDVHPSEATLLDNEFIPEKTMGDLSIYRRTYWELKDGKWAHKGLDGDYLRDGWYKIDGNFYYMNSEGLAETGWFEWEDNYYYLDENGKMAMFWQEIEDKWYYFGADGVMLSNVTVDGFTLGADGAVVDH